MSLFTLINIALVAARLVSAGWTNTDFTTALRCTTRYDRRANASSVEMDWLTTETQTTTEWLYFVKTELYTPKASTTSLSAIGTSYESSKIDEWTSIVTTATVTSSVTIQSIVTTTMTVTTTTSTATQRPNSNQAENGSESVISTHIEDKGDWEVADVYWTTEPDLNPSVTQNLTLSTKPAGVPVMVNCTLTTLSNEFWTTVSKKQSGATATYTRTTFVATKTSTLIAKTSRGKYDIRPNSTTTWEWSDVTWVTAYETSTTTSAATATETVYTEIGLPGPCDYDEGIFDPYHRFGLSKLDTGNLVEIFYHYKYNNDGKSYPYAPDCCKEAAQEPRAVAWYHRPYSGCSIYVGEHCPNTNGTLKGGCKEKATVYYDTTPGYEDDAYGSVGGGQCGDLEFVNVWA